jgi:Mrp family chromosome partitioning ATPase
MLRGQFDMIIIDSPPVLAATDAVLLSTQADATILVASAGATKEGDLDHSLERLDDVGANLIGVLLNRFDLSMAYGYKYSYGQYGPYSKYRYGQDMEMEKPWWKRIGQSKETA